jgi:hypothetical protein
MTIPMNVQGSKNILNNIILSGLEILFQQAERDLKKTYKGEVDLFVLDMYFPTKENTDTDRIEVDQNWEQFCIAENKLHTALMKVGQSMKGWQQTCKASSSPKRAICVLYPQGQSRCCD